MAISMVVDELLNHLSSEVFYAQRLEADYVEYFEFKKNTFPCERRCCLELWKAKSVSRAKKTVILPYTGTTSSYKYMENGLKIA